MDLTETFGIFGDLLNFFNLEYLYYLIYSLFTGGVDGNFSIRALFELVMSFVRPIALIISLLLVVGIAYSRFRLEQVRRAERMVQYGQSEVPDFATAGGQQTNTRWQRVQELIHSDQTGDWRRAILEADIILDEMLTRMGYAGDSLGEKLKQVERSDFKTLDKAWEAHKARNAIAHEGESFELSQRQARKIIDLFREVFEEFYFI